MKKIAFCTNESGYCLTSSIPSFILGGIFSVIVPLLMVRDSRKLVVYSRRKKHQKFIESIEVEEALELNANYSTKRYYLISSFNGSKTFYYMYLFKPLQKLMIIILICSIPTVNYLGEKILVGINMLGMFMFIILAIPQVFEMWLRPHRTLAHTLIYQTLGIVLCINVFLSWNASIGVRNPFLVDTSLFVLLIMINCFAFGCVILFLIVFIFSKTQWPVNSRVIETLITKYDCYIDAVKDGYLLYEYAVSAHPMFVRCDLLEKQKNILKEYYGQAIRDNNPMEETLENILLKLEEEHYLSSHTSILPHKPLQEVLGVLKERMDKRYEEMILFPFRKRVILLKILAFKAFLNGKDFSKPNSAKSRGSTTSENDTTSSDNNMLLEIQIPVDNEKSTKNASSLLKTEQKETSSQQENVGQISPSLMDTLSLKRESTKLKYQLKSFEEKYKKKFGKPPTKSKALQVYEFFSIYSRYKELVAELKKRTSSNKES